MAWNLSEKEQGALMEAVARVLDLYEISRPSSISFEGELMPLEDMTIMDPEAPEELKELDRVYSEIVEKGAVAVKPKVIEEHQGA